MKIIKKTLTQNSCSSGFGIIEVLISAMIIVIVVGATVGLGRAMVKRNIETTEKVQAYNLAREGLEIGRAYRDTKWINENVDEWNVDFPNNGVVFYFTSNTDGSFDIISNASGEVVSSENNVDYIRVYEFKNLNNITLEELNRIVDPDQDQQYDLTNEIQILNVSVSWNDDQNTVEASTILTDWKPQI